jgi:hypothetical protein
MVKVYDRNKGNRTIVFVKGAWNTQSLRNPFVSWADQTPFFIPADATFSASG